MIIALILTLLVNLIVLTPVGFKPGFLFLYFMMLLLTLFVEYLVTDLFDNRGISRILTINSVGAIGVLVVLVFGFLLNSPIVKSGD